MKSLIKSLKQLLGGPAPGTGADRRTDKRVGTRVPADLIAADGSRQRALVLDMSDGGLQLSIDAQEGAAPLPEGAVRVQLFDPLPDAPGGIDVTAQVVHRRPPSGDRQRLGLRIERDKRAAGQGQLDHVAAFAIPPEWETQVQRLIEQLHLEVPGDACRVVVATSASPREGVTTITRWLAMTLARDPKQRVLYVDAGFSRNGAFETQAGASNNQGGLIELIEGDEPIEQIVQRTPLANLDLISSGRGDIERALRLSETDLKSAIATLRDKYDYVLMDAAAASVSPFTYVLTRNVDGAFLIVSIGRGSRDKVAEVIEQIARYGGRVLGVVVNHIGKS